MKYCLNKECGYRDEREKNNCGALNSVDECSLDPLITNKANSSVPFSGVLGEPQFERNDTTDHVDEFSYHEVLDRASIIADMFDEHVLQHSVLKYESELKEEAAIICELLHKFYQHWGSVRSEKFA